VTVLLYCAVYLVEHIESISTILRPVVTTNTCGEGGIRRVGLEWIGMVWNYVELKWNGKTCWNYC